MTDTQRRGPTLNNGETTARVSVRRLENDHRKVEAIAPSPEQSNQVGELYAVLHTLRGVPRDQALRPQASLVIIRTDSKYTICGLMSNLEK